MENLNPKKKAKTESPTRSSSIADLPDSLVLNEIFLRLASYTTVISCKCVSKHWFSLLSNLNPKFVIDFVNKQKKNNNNKERFHQWTLSWLIGVNLNLIHDNPNDDGYRTNWDRSFIDIHNKVFSKLSMSFLSNHRSFTIAATFKDLVLCLDGSRNYYYICNPVTKRWVDVPPAPSPTSPGFWATLVCEDPFTSNRNIDDYRFRIVVVSFPTNFKSTPYDRKLFFTFKVLVFCSENCQWIDTNVRVPLDQTTRRTRYVPTIKGVVCKGMVCVCYDLYFGMFNPFDVTPMTTTGTTLTARGLPTPHMFCGTKLLECNGRLISVLLAGVTGPYYNDDEDVSVTISHGQLDLNRILDSNNDMVQDVSWTRCGRATFIDKTRRSCSAVLSGIRMISIHPTNCNLLFLLSASKELLLCDRRSQSLKLLGRCEQLSDPGRLNSSNHTRFEFQHWPTPVPTIRPSQPTLQFL